MRTVEEIEKELKDAREELSHIEGLPTEVYSRIVGYYRAVRNWNRGKREEYGERKLFEVTNSSIPETREAAAAAVEQENKDASTVNTTSLQDTRLMLFVRPACPACPTAKDAAHALGIPVELVDADTEAGLAEAVKYNVYATPTAILLNKDGKELGRAQDARSIRAFGATAHPIANDTAEAI